ncbi:hypothetical protein [Mesorhizobium amorphae]
MAGDWTLERVIFAPARVAELLNSAEQQMTQHNRRVTELLAANNRYLQDGRYWRMLLELLTEGELSLCFEQGDQPSCSICCFGGWTSWHDQYFTGSTFDEALGIAIVAFNKWKQGNG